MLKSCTLVCRSWTGPSTRLLFQRIHIRNGHTASTPEQPSPLSCFCEAIADPNSRLCATVRTLMMHGAVDLQSLRYAIEHLPCLQMLSLIFVNVVPGSLPPKYTTTSPAQRMNIEDLVVSGGLSDMLGDDPVSLFELFSWFSQVNHLRIDWPYQYTTTTSVPKMTTRKENYTPVYVRKLTVESFALSAGHLPHLIDLRALVHLETTVLNGAAARVLNRLFAEHKCGESLETCNIELHAPYEPRKDLTFDHETHGFPSPFPEGSCPVLHKLRLTYIAVVRRGWTTSLAHIVSPWEYYVAHILDPKVLPALRDILLDISLEVLGPEFVNSLYDPKEDPCHRLLDTLDWSLLDRWCADSSTARSVQIAVTLEDHDYPAQSKAPDHQYSKLIKSKVSRQVQDILSFTLAFASP
ncbi:hypothetical protein BDW22DRAFT_1044301 [Trametopsis cervina]|nr:hypothetical protein BDW22DRAFT_1044301 [Trametopsis cervina]